MVEELDGDVGQKPFRISNTEDEGDGDDVGR